MKKTFIQLAVTLVCISSSNNLGAQVLQSRRLPTSTGSTQAIQPVAKAPSESAAQPATSATNIKTGASQSTTPLVNRMPSRDSRTNLPGGRYNDPSMSTKANPALTGMYALSSMVDGIKVSKSFRLRKSVTSSIAVNGAGKRPVEQNTAGNIRISAKNSFTNKNDEKWDCNNDVRRVSLEDQGYLTLDVASQITKVLPGRAFHFDQYINGSWEEDQSLERKPFRISCSNPNIGGSVTENLADAREGTLRQAVANIYNRFPTDPAKVANLTFTMFAQEVHNTAELSVRIGGGGYGFGFSANNLFNFSEKSNQRSFFVDITKTLYTIDVEHPGGGLFADASANTSDMMYIASVTYGLRILASIQLDIKDQQIQNQFDAKYSGLAYGGDISADVFAKDVQNQATVKFYIVGGTGNTITPAFNIADMQKQLMEMTKYVNYNTAHPIRYSFKNNEGEVVSYASATDYFNYRSCQPPGENNKAANMSVRISNISLKNMDQDDVDLYGLVWANVYKADNGFLPPAENQYHMFQLAAGQHLKHEDIKKGDYSFGYGRTVEFNFDTGEAAGAVMYVYFDLTDQDDSPDDPIVMPNLSKYPIKMPDGSTREFYGLKIYLDKVQKSQQGGQVFTVDCVDNEGDYPFKIGITVERK